LRLRAVIPSSWGDETFDMVFTRLAIEQMEQIRECALSESHRVVKSHVVFVEPFKDFNLDPLQSLVTHAKNYISLNVSDLRKYGFDPIFQFADWPHKIKNGKGMIVCRKV
jgi:ubiquinone/menaquinone biosynthesis C-methylase UbiE